MSPLRVPELEAPAIGLSPRGGGSAGDSAGPSPRRAWKAPPEVLLFGIPLHNLAREEVLDFVVDRARSGVPGQIVTANLDFAFQAWRDPHMHRVHLEADLVLADGMPLVWLSRLFGPRLKERVAGSDLIFDLARTARDHGLSIYAIGGGPGVAERALRVLQERSPGLRVAGWESPPMAPLLDMDHETILRRVRSARPDILLVAFGMPKQDKWIRMHRGEWSVPVAIGVGASLDFLAGTQRRAPRWVQKIGMEWFWRMAAQPRRLARRYLTDFLYLARTLGQLLLLRLAPAATGPGSPRPDPARVLALGAAWAPLRPLARASEADTFCRLHEPAALDRSIVLDVSGFSWLNSLELSAMARLARACRRGHHRLFVAGASPRVAGLIRLFRLYRFLVLPTSARELERRLERLRSPASRPAVRVNRAGHRLQVLLPEEFGRDVLPEAREELLRELGTGGIREVVIDAGGVECVDSAGARFLRETHRMVDAGSGRSLWFLGFPKPLLETLRQDGLGFLRIDRRKRFRSDGVGRDA